MTNTMPNDGNLQTHLHRCLRRRRLSVDLSCRDNTFWLQKLVPTPPIEWSELPAGTKSLALIVDDPEAPGRVFTHWILFNIPSDTRKLPQALPTLPELTSGVLQGKNNFGRVGYGGPCLPPSQPHRYRFTVYALDEPLDLNAGVSKKQLIVAM